MLSGKPVKGFLSDVTGVLYDSSHGGGKAIQGSIEAVKRLYAESKVKFLSNESTATREKFVEKLEKLGFELKPNDLITPAPSCAKYIKEHNLRPHLLVYDDVIPEFDGCDFSDPNCVVVGDAEENFTYENLNKAFRLLHSNPEIPLLSLGTGKFYQRTDGPCIDVGAFTTALIYATGCKHIEMGKPSKEYFHNALEALGEKAEDVVMIGDDIISDIGGAQKLGMRGIQVRTGKYMKSWENHPEVNPTLISNNLLSAVKTILDS
jgi:phospholysine phosphohistidine inorganic pyrophosphate phosphatase